MALDPPKGFPDSYWLPVVAAEARARTDLLTALDKSPWQAAGSQRYLHWDQIKAAVLTYVAQFVGVFADQACVAVGQGELSLAELDRTVEGFVDIALHHVYFGLNLPKVTATWTSRHTSFAYEFRPVVMAQAWHRRYLAQVPLLFEAMSRPELALSQVSERRRAYVQPHLQRRGLTVSSWADAAGVDPSVAYDYLSGKSNPRPESRRALAEALGASPQDLP